MIKVRGPDGSINQFPDGTPDNVIENAMRQVFGGPEQGASANGAGAPYEAPPQPDTSFGQGAKIGTQAVGSGLAHTVGALPDLAAGALNAGMGAANLIGQGAEWATGLDLPQFEHRIEEPVMGGEWLKENFGKLFEMGGGDLVQPEEMTDRQRMLYSAEDFATQGAAGGALLGTPGAVKTAADELVPALTHPYKTAPVRTAIGDTGAGAGAGVAVEAADDYMPDWVPDPIKNLLAVVLGGSLGHSVTDMPGAIETAGRAIPDRVVKVRELHNDETGVTPSIRSADDAARFVQGAATDKDKALLEMRDADQFFSEAGGAKPTSATMTNDPGLQIMERGARDIKSRPFVERDAAVKESAQNDLNAMRPDYADPTVPRQMAEGIDTSIQDEMAQIAAALEQAKLADQQLGEGYKPYAGGADAASEALDKVIVGDTLKPMQAEKNRLYEDIDPEGTTMLSTDNLVALAKELEAAASGQFPSLRDTPDALISDIKKTEPKYDPETGENVGGKGEMSFKDMNAMRPQLSDKITQSRKSGQFGLADQYKKVKGAISDEANALESPEAQAASQYYKEDFAPFTRGEGGKLRKDINADDLHRSNTPPTATAGRFLKKGGPGAKEAASDMQHILTRSPDPQAGQKAAYDYVLDDLSKTVLRADGTIAERALQTWINQREGMLSQIPEIAKEVDDLLNQVRSNKGRIDLLEGETKRVEADAEDFGKSALSIFVGKDPDKAIAGVLGSNDPVGAVRELKSLFGAEKAANEGLKAAVADHLITRLTDAKDLPTHQKIASALKKYEPVLQEVFGDDMKYLRQAQKRMEALSKRSPQAVPGSGTAERSGARGLFDKAMKPAEVVMRVMFGALRGGSEVRKLKLMGEQLPDSSAAAQELIFRFSFDPKVAKHLLARPVAEIGTPTWNKELNKLMGWAAAGRASGEESKR